MRHQIAMFLRRLLGAGGLNDLRQMLTESRQMQMTMFEQLRHLERELKQAELRQFMSRLHALSMRCRMQQSANGQQYDDANGIADHYARLVSQIGRFWVGQGLMPPDLFPDDDCSLDYTIRNNIYVPGNEAEIDPRRLYFPWHHLFSDPDCGVFLVLGQSNAANHGDTLYDVHHESYSLDFLRMRCYRSSDPMPGASGSGGSVWSRLGGALVEHKIFRNVLFVPLAFGGTFVTDWIPGGGMHRRLALALRRIRQELRTPVLMFSGVFWQQGEAEANHTQMSGPQYQAHVRDVVASLREHGVFAPVFVAQCTTCDAGSHPYNNHDVIRHAQMGVVDPGGGILAGPNSDLIGSDKRYDGCHFAEKGLAECAKAWLDVISKKRSLLNKP